MQSFDRQLQGSTCNGQQALTEKEKSFKNYGKSNKELTAQIEKKFQIFVKSKKSRKIEKEFQHFQEM